MNIETLMKHHVLQVIRPGQEMFELSSDVKSPFYVDFRRAAGIPEVRDSIMSTLVDIFGELENIDTVVGVASGGIPWASFLSLILSKDLAYVDPKKHGNKKVIQGSIQGRVMVIEDVVTTGASCRYTLSRLSEHNVSTVVVLYATSRPALRSLTPNACSLMNSTSLIFDARAQNLIDDIQYELCTQYIRELEEKDNVSTE